jgi:MoxR-like ATPase
MLTDNIKSEIKKVIVGKDEIIEKVLTAILAQGHILLEDVPGVGKALHLLFQRHSDLTANVFSSHRTQCLPM